MLYVLIILAILLVALLLLRLRLRLEISSDRRLLFVGLGHSGSEFDFQAQRGVLKLFGLRIKQFELGGGEPIKKKITKAEETGKIKKTPAKPKRKRSIREIAAIAPQSLKALGKYLLGLIRTAIVEQAEGEIEAGFESPHITGEVFGYYQAALAVAPGLGRIQYFPDWTGPSFSGSVRFSVAWPVHRLVGQTVLLLFRLPVRKIIKLAIGTKEGGQDGK